MSRGLLSTFLFQGKGVTGMLFLPREEGQRFSHHLGEIGQGLVEYGFGLALLLAILTAIAELLGVTVAEVIAFLGLQPLPWW
jgi:hypothetical protein